MCDLCRTSAGLLSRRKLLFSGAAAWAASGLPALAQDPSTSAIAPPQNVISPDAALERIMQGNARYVSGSSVAEDHAAGRDARVAAQYPIAAILSCADSRVAPELAFDQAQGDLFVVRIAGNFVDDGGLASMEYGVKFLGVPLLMVLGHSQCGAVSAAIKVIKEKTRLPGHLPGLVDSIKPSVRRAILRKPADLLVASIEENVRTNVRRLATAKPILSVANSARQIRVVGGVYDLATGRITLL